MIWNLALCTIHAAALAGFIALYRKAPCWMQKVTVGLLIVGMAIIAGAYAMAAGGIWWNFHVRFVGWAFLDAAMLLYVFRLIYQQHLEWKPSSVPFRSL